MSRIGTVRLVSQGFAPTGKLQNIPNKVRASKSRLPRCVTFVYAAEIPRILEWAKERGAETNVVAIRKDRNRLAVGVCHHENRHTELERVGTPFECALWEESSGEAVRWHLVFLSGHLLETP